jgi:hypothetical protein
VLVLTAVITLAPLQLSYYICCFWDLHMLQQSVPVFCCTSWCLMKLGQGRSHAFPLQLVNQLAFVGGTCAV